ncbi:PKD domain-containing protein [Snuella sedimenti]|uniref:PKD domain-containing protein n=1 Tax=Snuella sedimenti TaxID=2798802 RepID=A0A8J7LYI8_9FLAO|nr:PKD domain-containing protein [Snuella sedimenti]MBJ6368441.1 PKD domain-containing protein [Snuella sedimenti]
MKTIKFKLGVILLLALIFGCQDDEGIVGDIVAPSNVNMNAEIVGMDANNPNGDGSGLVNFTTSSDGAITYRYDFGDNTDVVVAPSGNITHQFSLTGLNTYTVTVMASGIGGITTTTSMNIDVFSSFEDQEAKDFLTGGAGNSKKWYWAADKPGNIGLGPNDVQPGGEHTWSQWFTSNAWHSDKLCMYDAEFVFTQSADGKVTFEQLTDIAYTPGDFAASIGVAGDTCHGTDVAPTLDGVKNVSFSPSNSNATVDGEYRGTTINFSDGGFMCWYVGISSIEIYEITDSTLSVRMLDASNPALAWYCKYQTDNPND